MQISHRRILIVAFAIGYYHINVEAQVSLYIPGFEPQPVSADILGIGSDGRTAWALHQGTIIDSDSFGSSQFIGTATLVEGSGYASLTYANEAAQFTIDQICSLSGGFAVCTIAGQGSTNVQTELISSLPVQTGPNSLSGVETTRSSMQTSPMPSASSNSQVNPRPSATNQPPPSPLLPSSGCTIMRHPLLYFIVMTVLISLCTFVIL